MTSTISISSESDLWEWLQRLSEEAETSNYEIEIVDWRPRLLYFPDAPVGHSISPTVARALTEYHASISRTYAYLVYGQANARLLKREDREILDIYFYVLSGSTGIEVLETLLNELVGKMVNTMTGEQITISVVAFLVLYFGSTTAKAWISERYNEKREARNSEERLRLSEQETERMRVLSDLSSKNVKVAQVQEHAAEATSSLVRPATKHGRSQILGTDISSEEARIILSKERDSGEGRRLDGYYEVEKIDTQTESGYIAQIRNIETSQRLSAEMNYEELTHDDVHVVFEGAERKREIYALVNAWFVNEKIVRAQIMRAHPEKP